jgi:hypothetical protein
MLQGIKVGGVELKVHAVEILGHAALGAVEILHPAMQVRMLAPGGEFLALTGGEVDRRGWRVAGCEGVPIEAHCCFLSLAGRPEGRDRKAGRLKGGMS